MPEWFTELLTILGNAAGWTVAVAVLLVGGWGFHKGWWVPGFIYDREVKRGDRAEDAVDASTKTSQTAAAATETAAHAALSVARQLSHLQRSVDDLHHPDEPG